MFIENIHYIPVGELTSCSMSASLAMLLGFYDIDNNPEYVIDTYARTFLSSEFLSWQLRSLNTNKPDNAMLACALYMCGKTYPTISADIITTTIERIPGSYIKRKMPVILTGRFPLRHGCIVNSVVVRGFIDNHLIINDPRGNANNRYHDTYGENMLYSFDLLRRYNDDADTVSIFRFSAGKLKSD